MQRRVTLTLMIGLLAYSAALGAQKSPPVDPNAPKLSGVTIGLVDRKDAAIEFTVEVRPGKAEFPGKNGGMWFSLGAASLRDELVKSLNEVKTGQISYLMSLYGRGFISGRCSGLKKVEGKENTWTGLIAVRGLDMTGTQVDIRDRLYPVTALPIRLYAWDQDYVLSDELKIKVNVKDAKVAE